MKPYRPAFFFDRDGVVNQPPPPAMRYLRRWEDFHFIEGMPALLAEVKAAGYLMVLITNQQGVGKGLMSAEDLAELHRAMQAELAEHGAAFDRIYAATGLAEVDHRRKPSPQMLHEAASDLGITLAQSWMIGDHDNDMRAGKAAGTGTIRVVGEKAVTVSSDHEARTVDELATVIRTLFTG